MTAPGGLLDFFVLEAGECLEQLDGLIAGAGPAGPDADALQREARRLRGSATMARLTGFTELAAAVERVARALRERTLAWDLAVGGTMTRAIDDLKALLHRVRTWGEAEQQTAATRTAELDRIAPPVPRAPVSAPAVGALGTAFLALEADELAMALAGLRARPGDRQHLDALVQRVRRLRGIAALKDLPPLGEVIEGVERAIRPLEQEAGVLGDLHHEVLAAGTDVLARAAVALRTGDRPSANSPETTRFASALAALESDAGDGDRIVPISELFYQDAGPHVVERAAAPATTPRHRFRADVVSLAEHLRRLVGDARAAADLVARDRMGRELRSAIRTLRNMAESFGESLVGQFAARILDAAARLERDALTQLDEVAGQLATTQGDPSDRIAAFLSAPAAPPRVTRAPTPAWVPPAPPTPAPVWVPPAPPTPAPPRAPSIVMPASALAPTGRELHDLLATGLAGLDRLEREPMAQPTPVEDDSVVPIDRLLYRGRAALDRAIAIRNGIRTRQAVPSPDELDELFDLLDLVGTE